MQKLNSLIDNLHLEDLKNPEHPSVFDENDNYNMLIVRLPVLVNGYSTHSFSFIFTASKSFLYDKDIGEFKDLEDKFEGPYKILNKYVDRLMKSFNKYKDEISDMEEILYTHKETSQFMTSWLELKQDIVRIERVLLRTAESMQEFLEYYQNDESFPMNSFTDLHEHLDRVLRSSTLQLSKLDYLYNYYGARTNEKMNKSVYLLTVISAVFLPLNLVVGFFGMNTSSLPFSDGGFGTLKAVVLMVSLVVVTSLIAYLWQKKVDDS